MKQSLYTMICPPVFADETDSRALDRYYNYLRELQREYLELLETDVQFRRCQRCGRYFILKGNYNTRYVCAT